MQLGELNQLNRSANPESDLSQYLAFPFESDANFKKGLSDIVSLSGSSSDIPEDTLRSMRVFYFNRITGHSLTVADVQAYESNRNSTGDILTSTSNTPGNADVESSSVESFSFAQIQALIEAGRFDEIPNNKTISTELNSSSPDRSTVSPRKKPWEN
ncbi:hypothetical protein F5050DRAFT_1786952 [Lentinula boryana]|uniref:Uncharacterized protein n=1 Tax=Lentinula boryana TaxID=40481 RepID=A0ABQ8Q2V4_9AGAR|nr:hypothetical protein F5050DRAFT_1786952 [Lentinula boryana]